MKTPQSFSICRRLAFPMRVIYEPVPEERGCDDTDACTPESVCDGKGSCVGVGQVSCLIDHQCAVGTCDKEKGCVYEYPDEKCDDGDDCTIDTCGENGCENRPQCDDDNPCRAYRCDDGECVWEAVSGSCTNPACPEVQGRCSNGGCIAPCEAITAPLATSQNGNLGRFSANPALRTASESFEPGVAPIENGAESANESSCSVTSGKPSRNFAAIWLAVAGLALSRRRRPRAAGVRTMLRR